MLYFSLIIIGKEVNDLKIFTGDVEYFHELMRQRYEVMVKSYDETRKVFEKWKRKASPNNKLKMSGKPMKRRGV